MTETARHADYVLPAASQYEKWESTFFNLEFPRNTFHLRQPLLDPLPGTLPEPEIHARIVRALGAIEEEALAPLRGCRAGSRAVRHCLRRGGRTRSSNHGPRFLRALRDARPDPARRCGRRRGALRARAALCDDLSGGGPAGGTPTATRCSTRSSAAGPGITFTLDDYEDAWNYVSHPDKRFPLVIRELLDELRSLAVEQPGWTTDEFPFVLSAGERRSSTANTIIRDPDWRKRDRDGAPRMSNEDAARLGLKDGGRVVVTTAAGAAEATVEITDAMMPGHVSLPAARVWTTPRPTAAGPTVRLRVVRSAGMRGRAVRDPAVTVPPGGARRS